MPWSWEVPNNTSPQYKYTPPPPDPFEGDTRQEDSGFVAEPEVQRRIDSALTQYRQEQQAALRNMNPPATYGAPGRQTLPPITAQAVQSRDYNIPDRVLGQEAIQPLPWETTSYAPPPMARQEQQVTQQFAPQGYPMQGLPQAPRGDNRFAYNIGNVQASSVAPSTFQPPPVTQQVRTGRQELVDYAGNVGIPMMQASQVQPQAPRDPYDPTNGYFAWNNSAPRVQALPWAEPAIQPLPWTVSTSVSPWTR